MSRPEQDNTAQEVDRTVSDPGVEQQIASRQTFLATRFSPSRREEDFISRACVTTLVEVAKSRRLVLIKAPAGYGKTTIAAGAYWKLKGDDRSAAWLNLANFDGTLTEFARYLAQALSWEAITPLAQGTKLPGAWFEMPSVQSLAMALCNAANQFAEPFYLFLDDFDSIIGSEAEQLIHRLLRDAPVNFHIILSSRASPSFGLGRLRMRDQILELGVEQMRFSYEEAAQLLEGKSTEPVPRDLVEMALEKTEGWPAGLQLVGFLFSHSDDVKALLTSFSGQLLDVGEFLAEDVLDKLDPELTDFLVETSVLSRFCAPLCDAIRGRSDSREMIDQLERQSLFVFALDGERKWYRYQALFSDFLSRILQETRPNLDTALHIKAAHWYVANDLFVQGITHATKAEDFALAAKLLNEHAEEIMSRGLFDALQRLITSLPDTVLADHPRLRVWEATCLIFNRAFVEAVRLLDEVEASLSLSDEGKASYDTDDQELSKALVLARIMAAEFRDDMPELAKLCLMVNPDDFNENDIMVGGVYCSLIHAQREQYDLGQVERLSSLARESFVRANQPMPLILLESVLGPTFAQRGELDLALKCYVRAQRVCEEQLDDGHAVWASFSALKADLMLEQLEFEQARSDFETNRNSSRRGIGFVENLIASFVGRSRMAAFEGRYEEADELLRDGIAYAIAQSIERLRWCCVDERIRQHLRRKEHWEVERIATEVGLPEKADALYPKGELTTQREAVAKAWARWKLAQGEPKEALGLLKKWLTFVERRRCVRSQVSLSILVAQTYLILGETRSALRTLNEIMPHVAKSGLIFGLVEEGEPLRSLLIRSYDLAASPNWSNQDFAHHLKQAINSEAARRLAIKPLPLAGLSAQDAVQSETLNAKELEILHMVARSMLNREIAERLGLTEGSVKWYLQQIYDKLGVRRRHAALERARALGHI